jgi:hypothetical protein
MLHLSTLLLCLVLAWPQTAAAQDPRLEARLDSTTRARVERTLAAARADGLPTEPLVQKALEGSSKGAAGPRIATAVETMLLDLRSARSALGPGAAPGELVAASAAMRAGASSAMVGEMRRLAPRDGVAVPLAVFTDLVAGGMTVDTAWRSVDELARNGGGEQEFLQLRDRLGPRVAP